MAIVGAVIAAVGIGASLKGAKDAKDAAKAASAEEARLEGILTSARLYQMEQDFEAMQGSTVAAAAASGVEVGVGSVLDILDSNTDRYKREYGATRDAGATRAANALTRGRMAADQAHYQGISNALGFAANVNWSGLFGP